MTTTIHRAHNLSLDKLNNTNHAARKCRVVFLLGWKIAKPQAASWYQTSFDNYSAPFAFQVPDSIILCYMALSTDITLPRRITPVFPDVCIACQSTPDSSTKITQNSQHWLISFFLPILHLFGWSRVEIPICRRCKPRFYFQRWGRTAICWAIAIGVIAIAWPYFNEWDRLTKKIAIAGIGILAIAPYIAFEVLWPRLFDTTAEGDKVTYEFASEEYAKLFYLMNDEHILESDIEFVGGDE
jgi:hypothetical protein